jgi:hypothetical protein
VATIIYCYTSCTRRIHIVEREGLGHDERSDECSKGTSSITCLVKPVLLTCIALCKKKKKMLLSKTMISKTIFLDNLKTTKFPAKTEAYKQVGQIS